MIGLLGVIPGAIRGEILHGLHGPEAVHRVRILYACQSGTWPVGSLRQTPTTA